MLPDRQAALGIKGRGIGRLSTDRALEHGGRRVGIDEVSKPRRGQRMAFVMDTGMCDAAVDLAKGAELVVYEATFASVDIHLARHYRHLTAADAARVARDAGGRRLVITHFSQRYPDVPVLLDQARTVFDDVMAALDLLRLPVPARLG